MRRLSFAWALVAVLLVSTAGAALASYNFRMISPARNTVNDVKSDLVVTIEVDRHQHCGLLGCNPDPPLKTGDVWLETWSGSNKIGGAVNATCTSNCGDGDYGTSTWQKTITPSGAPLPVVCNGQYRLRAFSKGGQVIAEARLNFASPPGTPKGVTASGSVGDVTIAWTPSTLPDVFGVAVARQSASQAASNTWTTLTPELLARDVSTFRDTTVKASDLPVSYRVAFVRHDGKVGGSWVDGCTDGSTTIDEVFAAQTLSLTEVAGNVTAPQPSPNPSETGTGGPSEKPSNPDQNNTDPDETPTSPTRPTTTPTEPDGGSDSGNVDRPRTPRVTAPNRPAPDVRYYGDDLGFSEELDFGGLDPITGDPNGDETEPGEVAGAVEVSTLERVFNEDVVAKSVAGGLIFLALALHLRRWTLEA